MIMREKINFAWPVTSENAIVYRHLLSKVEQFKNLLIGKRVVIFGAGIRGCCLLHILEQDGFKNIIFCDNNIQKQGHLINEYSIVSFDEARGYEGEQIFLISPEDSGAMSSQLTKIGFYEEKDWLSFEFSVYDAYIAEYLRFVNGHALFMGDCAFSHIALTDQSTDSLGDMIKTCIGENRCKVLAMHGIGQQASYHIIHSLLHKGERPSVVVLLLVMEVLTPKSHLMPRTQHPTLMRSLVEAISNPPTPFVEYAKLAQERFDRLQVESFASFMADKSAANEKLYMKMNYLFKLRESTEGVRYLKKNISLLNNEQIPIVLYVPPVNYMQGEEFFGVNFKLKYRENFATLYQFLDNEDLHYTVADASFLLTQKEFAAKNTIDETSNFAGRKKLLDFLSKNELLQPMFG